MLSFCNGWISFSRRTADSNAKVAPETSAAHLKFRCGAWACAMMFSVKNSLHRGNVKSLFKPKAGSDEPELHPPLLKKELLKTE